MFLLSILVRDKGEGCVGVYFCVCSRNDNKCDYSGLLGLNLDNEVIPKSTHRPTYSLQLLSVKPKGDWFTIT